MGTKTVSLRISQELFDYLHEQSAKTGETITDIFWSMYKLTGDSEIHNKYNENIEDIENNIIYDTPDLEIYNNKNYRNKHIYVETTEEKNNIITYLNQHDIFLDDHSYIDWIYNNRKETKIIINGKIIIKKVFTNLLEE